MTVITRLKTFFASAFVVCASNVPVTFASDYGTTGLIDIPTARFDADGVLLSVHRATNDTDSSLLPIRQHRGYRAHSGTRALMSFIGTATTNSRLGSGKKSYTCLRWPWG